MSNQANSNNLTFQQAYARLQQITTQLQQNPEDIDANIDLYREAKSLEQALQQYLQDKEQELQSIQEGQGLLPVNIVSSSAKAEASTNSNSEPVSDVSAVADGTGKELF